MLSDEEWERIGFWPGSFYHFYEQFEIDPEDLCKSCRGYGHQWPDDPGGAQAFCGEMCVICTGTGLVEGEKRARLLLTKQLRKIPTKDLPLARIKEAIDFLRSDE